MAKITKRKRSLGEHVDAITKIPAGIKFWFQRMRGSWVYREMFQAAVWGEMGEYEVRSSTFAGLFYCFLGIAGFIAMQGTRFSSRTRFILTIAFIIFIFVIGFRQFKDLQGPIWWADRFATRAHDDYQKTGKFRPYNRYGAYFRSQVQVAPPLKLEEMAFLCELYHQLCTGTVTTDALCELGFYTAQDINYFYRYFDIRQGDTLFPVQYIGYRLARQP